MPHKKGMGWIRLHKRMSIYHRDDFDCIWCRCVFPLDLKGYGLTLDHLHSDDNDASNLVTSCHHCNTIRWQDPVADWIERLVEHGHSAQTLRARIARQTAKKLDRQAGIYLAKLRRPNYIIR